MDSWTVQGDTHPSQVEFTLLPEAYTKELLVKQMLISHTASVQLEKNFTVKLQKASLNEEFVSCFKSCH